MAACIAPPIVFLCLATAVACSDVVQPTKRDEPDWAEATLVGMQVDVTSRAIRDDGEMTLPPISRSENVRVLRFPDQSQERNQARFSVRGRGVQVRHLRDSDGRVISVAELRDQPGGPPKRVYFFRDGKIQMVVSPRFERRGRGWLQTAVRTTVFDSSGRPLLQSDWRARAASPSDGFLTPADATQAAFAGDDLDGDDGSDAESENSKPCAREAQELRIRNSEAAIASALWAAAFGTCLYLGDRCDEVAGLGLVVIAKADAAWKAYQAWLDCKNRFPSLPDIAGGDGGGDDVAAIDWDRSLRMTVQDFIDKAEAGGTYYCTDGGNRCVYFAAS